MANTPCARLAKPISPMVTDRPTEITYRIMPSAAPWKATLTTDARTACTQSLPRVQINEPRVTARVARGDRYLILFLVVDDVVVVVHRGLHGVQVDVLEFAADLARVGQVLVLHDVPRLRVDRDRAARTVGAL